MSQDRNDRVLQYLNEQWPELATRQQIAQALQLSESVVGHCLRFLANGSKVIEGPKQGRTKTYLYAVTEPEPVIEEPTPQPTPIIPQSNKAPSNGSAPPSARPAIFYQPTVDPYNTNPATPHNTVSPYRVEFTTSAHEDPIDQELLQLRQRAEELLQRRNQLAAQQASEEKKRLRGAITQLEGEIETLQGRLLGLNGQAAL